MQALILAGGEGTRLRPLTSTMPKPVVPLVDRPFIAFMIEWLARHGVDDVVLSCGFMADGVRRVMGDGSALGVRLRYVEEPRPLGTGGAVKFAQELLDERFLVLNGDLLTDIDLTAQIEQHERTGARATLALIEVEDPSAYGLVRCDETSQVRSFVEKPRPEEIGGRLVNAGAYVLEREVLERMGESGRNVSIERDVFPTMIGQGLYGYAAGGYWLDIGTPDRYLRATFDILEGNVLTGVVARTADDAVIAGRVVGPALTGPGSAVAERAVVGALAVLGRNVTVGAGARIETSVVLDDSSIGAEALVNGSIIARGVTIGEGCRITGGVVIGDGARIGPGNILAAGVRIFPRVELPEGAIRF